MGQKFDFNYEIPACMTESEALLPALPSPEAFQSPQYRKSVSPDENSPKHTQTLQYGL